MAEIKLTQGYTAFIDDDDLELVSRYRWHVLVAKRNDGSIRDVYAARNQVLNGKSRSQLLHRFILGVTDRRMHIDHMDHNGLNCRRANIRTSTAVQNSANARRQRRKSGGLKGACWHKRTSKWQAQIGEEGRMRFLGYYDTKEEAHEAYKRAAKETFGEFSCAG